MAFFKPPSTFHPGLGPGTYNLWQDSVVPTTRGAEASFPGAFFVGYTFRLNWAATDFHPPNLVLGILPPPPVGTVDLSQAVNAGRGIFTDFAPPNLLAQSTLPPPPIIQGELPGWAIRAKGVYTDFNPPNLLTPGTLKPPPITPAHDSSRTFWKGVFTDFAPPNLLASKFLPPPPVAAVDLSQQVKYRWSATDFHPPNLLASKFLPPPPFAAIDQPRGITIRGVFSDFAAPNLILSELKAAAPFTPQDTAGMRLSARQTGTDFSPPNLLLGTLAIVPAPTATAAGRHKSRAEAHQRHQQDVLHARIEAFKAQRESAAQALIESEDGETVARAQILKRIGVRRKPIEDYASVQRAAARKAATLQQYRDILGSLERAQLAQQQIEHEIRAADQEAALYLMQWLMMETEWRE